MIVLLGTLLAYGCQPSKLQVTGEDAVEKAHNAMTPAQQSTQHYQEISPSEQSSERPDTIVQRESTNKSTPSCSTTGKRSLPHDSTPIVSADKKVCSVSFSTHTPPPQASSSAAVSDSTSPLELILKKREQDIEEALKSKKRTVTTKEMGEEAFGAFQEWFKRFATKVDHEETTCEEETAKAMAELVEEGNQKAYLTKALEVNLHELDWNTDFTPLHYAAARGNHQAVEELLKYVNVDIKNSEKCIPLHFAAYAGYTTVAKSLIDQCKKENNMLAVLNAKDDQGSSPIFYAAGGPRAHGNAQVIALLVENGVDLTQTLDESTLIDIAASLGNVEVVEYCLTKIKEVVLPQGSSVASIIESAMKLAKKEEQYDTFVMLRDYLEDVNKDK